MNQYPGFRGDISWLPAGDDPVGGYYGEIQNHLGDLETYAAELFEMVELGCDWKVTLAWYNVDQAVRSLRGAQHWLWRIKEAAL